MCKQLFQLDVSFLVKRPKQEKAQKRHLLTRQQERETSRGKTNGHSDKIR